MNLAHLSVSLVCALSLGLSGCANQTPAQKRKAVAVGTQVLGGVLDFTQFAANLAVQIVLKKAQGPGDALDKANKLDSAALALRTLETDTDGFVRPEDVAAVVTQFTDPTKAHWDKLAAAIADQIAAADDPNVALEQAAAGFNQVAATTRVNAEAVGNP